MIHPRRDCRSSSVYITCSTAIALVYAFAAGLKTIAHFDLGWQWIVEHHQIPSTEVFTYTAAGQPWIYPVGSGLLFYGLYLLGGYALRQADALATHSQLIAEWAAMPLKWAQILSGLSPRDPQEFYVLLLILISGYTDRLKRHSSRSTGRRTVFGGNRSSLSIMSSWRISRMDVPVPGIGSEICHARFSLKRRRSACCRPMPRHGSSSRVSMTGPDGIKPRISCARMP